MTASGLTFGVFPLGIAGTPTGVATGPKDDYDKIGETIHDLRSGGKKMLTRNYVVYTGPESEEMWMSTIEKYCRHGVADALTVGCMQDQESFNLDTWLEFVRKVIRRFGSRLESFQVTNEPNLSFMDGSKPYVLEALVHGVIAAKREIRDNQLSVKVGFGSVPDGQMAVPHFWENLAKAADPAFYESLDFVAHNFYVDVFEEPLELEQVPVSVETTLRRLREENLKAACIPASVSIRIGENGWPTGMNPFLKLERTYEHQTKVLEAVIRKTYRLREELNITHYFLFELRDADSNKDELFYQFGVIRDDYSPKPAYHTFKKLVHELGN